MLRHFALSLVLSAAAVVAAPISPHAQTLLNDGLRVQGAGPYRDTPEGTAVGLATRQLRSEPLSWLAIARANNGTDMTGTTVLVDPAALSVTIEPHSANPVPQNQSDP